MNREFFKNLLKKSKNPGHKQFLYIIFIIGTVIMLCGGAGWKKIDVLKGNVKNTEIKTDTYAGGEEERIKRILSEIKDVGKTEVMVSYSAQSAEDGGEYKAVFAGTEPEKRRINGVIVVCEGAKNVSVRQKITEAVCALTGVYEHNVAVFEKK